MNARTIVAFLLAGLATGALPGHGAVGTTLAWDPPASAPGAASLPPPAGYKIHYGTAPRTYSTVLDVGPATTATIPDLTPGQTYFITVTSYDASANESGYAEELAWTPAPTAGIASDGIAGIPPSISLTLGDGSMKMGILGTVGADIRFQTSTNISSPFAWEPLLDLLLTNAAAAGDGALAAAARSTLETAFVPAFAWVTPGTETSGPIRFFRAIMPYNYAVLADKVLRSKGYQTRLVVVRLPGTTLHDVCYVGEDQAYIAGSEDHHLLAMHYSGATIRDIANDYSDHVKMNWTSASEFVFASGNRQLVATVVKTESPASDPSPASVTTPGIAVDF